MNELSLLVIFLLFIILLTKILQEYEYKSFIRSPYMERFNVPYHGM